MKIPMRAARVASGMSQEKLAETMGVSRATVIHWESGKAAMRIPDRFMFCALVGMPEDDIIFPQKSTK